MWHIRDLNSNECTLWVLGEWHSFQKSQSGLYPLWTTGPSLGYGAVELWLSWTGWEASTTQYGLQCHWTFIHKEQGTSFCFILEITTNHWRLGVSLAETLIDCYTQLGVIWDGIWKRGWTLSLGGSDLGGDLINILVHVRDFWRWSLFCLHHGPAGFSKEPWVVLGEWRGIRR